MDTMNVGSSFSYVHVDQEVGEGEEEFDVDEDGEGLIGASRGRTGKYTMAEDRLLCNTWLNIGMDPTTSTDQTRDTNWMRMKESGNVRTMRSIVCYSVLVCICLFFYMTHFFSFIHYVE
jgi:hypothetical protein